MLMSFLNFVWMAAQVNGVAGILQIYEEKIRHILFAGPTLFGPVINKATMVAREGAAKNLHKYYVLMIITVMLPSLHSF